MKCLLTALLALAAALPVAAQQPQPNAAADAANRKLRDSLRTYMTQLQAAEADKAALQLELDSTKSDTDKKIKALTKDLDALRKKSAEEKNAADKSILDLSAKVANIEQELARTKETLGKWKEAYAKAAAIAVKKESERVVLAGKVVVLERRVTSNEAKNAEMFKIGNEILDRYKNFGLGTAITAREPFTGIMRVKLQNLMQSYEEKLVAQKIRPGDAEAAKEEPKKDEKETKDAKPAAPKEKTAEPKAKS